MDFILCDVVSQGKIVCMDGESGLTHLVCGQAVGVAVWHPYDSCN